MDVPGIYCWLEKMGLDRTRFGLHNLRSGGTSAASNASVCDRLIMKHGRWANEKSKNLYIHEKLETKLSVTKNMKWFIGLHCFS